LTVVAILAGDYNHDGSVNAADYVLWRKNDGSQAGYDAWRTHFGRTAGSGSVATGNATVPEPATCVMLMFAVAGWCLRRGRTALKVPSSR
jgi:PEP-CTERM motif